MTREESVVLQTLKSHSWQHSHHSQGVHIGVDDVVGGFHRPPSRQPHAMLTHPLLLARAATCDNHDHNFYRESPISEPSLILNNPKS
jgi:hypothetical protein